MGFSGVSTFDLLGDMPAGQRTLMRLFLRRIKMTVPELEQAVAELPEEKRLSAETLQESLTALLERGWLSRSENDGMPVYSIHQAH
jgi:hypothetical protein